MESWMTVYNWPVFRCPQLAGFEVSPEVTTILKNTELLALLEKRISALDDYYLRLGFRGSPLA